MKEINVEGYSAEDIKKIAYSNIEKINKNKKWLEDIWDQITKLSDKVEEDSMPYMISTLQKLRLQAVSIRNETEELYQLIDHINSIRRLQEQFENNPNDMETRMQLGIEYSELKEELDLITSNKELSDEEKEKDGSEDITPSDQEIKKDDEVTAETETKDSDESNKENNDENSDKDKKDQNKKDKTLSEEELKKFLENIDKEYNEFIESNTKMLKDNDDNIERCYINFSQSLDNRYDVVEAQLAKVKKYLASTPDDEELQKRQEKLSQQLEDIKSDNSLLDDWVNKKEKLDNNINVAKEKIKEIRKLKAKIKGLRRFINNPKNKDNKEELEAKTNELNELIKQKKEKNAEINTLKKDNKKLLDEINDMAGKFKTVDKEALSIEEETTNKDEKGKTSEKKEGVEVEMYQSQPAPNGAVYTHSANFEAPALNWPPAREVPPDPAAQTQAEEIANTQNNDNRSLPQMSYKEIIQQYINTDPALKSYKFLETNFSTIMLAFDDALKHGKINGFQRDKLKAHLKLHNGRVVRALSDFNSEKLANIVESIYKDDTEQIEKYTYVDQESGVRYMNMGVFESIYNKQPNTGNVLLRDLSNVSDETSQFITSLFMRYHKQLKTGEITEDSELFKQFNRYIGNPVKAQILIKSGNRVCNKFKTMVDKIKMKFSHKARTKFKAQNDFNEFFVKMDKACNVYNEGGEERKKLDLRDSVEQNPPEINEVFRGENQEPHIDVR